MTSFESVESMLTPQVIMVMFVCWSLFAIPAALVLKKIGRHPGWALLCYVPLLAMIGLWVMALTPAPKSGGMA